MRVDPFGNLDPDDLEENYEGEIQVGDQAIKCDINFESEAVEPGILQSAAEFVVGLDRLIPIAFEALSRDFDRGEESEAARMYLEYHLEEFSDDELKEVFGTKNVSKKVFLQSINASRIGLYPQDAEAYAIVDVMLPRQYTDYLLSVTFNAKAEVMSVAMES